MKRIYTILLMLTLASLIPDTILAENQSTYTTTVYKGKKQSEHNQHLDCEGRRTPPIPLICSISNTTGLSIIGCDEDIITFEIWDITSENCLASFANESDFVDYLFAQCGEFILKFETEDYLFHGYIIID